MTGLPCGTRARDPVVGNLMRKSVAHRDPAMAIVTCQIVYPGMDIEIVRLPGTTQITCQTTELPTLLARQDK